MPIFVCSCDLLELYGHLLIVLRPLQQRFLHPMLQAPILRPSVWPIPPVMEMSEDRNQYHEVLPLEPTGSLPRGGKIPGLPCLDMSISIGA